MKVRYKQSNNHVPKTKNAEKPLFTVYILYIKFFFKNKKNKLKTWNSNHFQKTKYN